MMHLVPAAQLPVSECLRGELYSRFRDEYLNLEVFQSLAEAEVQNEQWRRATTRSAPTGCGRGGKR